VHWVHVLWGVESDAERKEIVEFASPSCPGLPGETGGRPTPCEPRTPGLAELQGHLGILHRYHNLCRSGVVAKVSLGGWRYPHVETRLVASSLAVAQVLLDKLVGTYTNKSP
jgi:hypothetical protein